MESPLWFSIPIWLGIIGGCVWLAVKARSRRARIIAGIGAALSFLALSGGTYTWLTYIRPLPKPSGQQEAAAVKALDELVAAWCAEDWDAVWNKTASLGKEEKYREKFVNVIWKRFKAQDFPGGVQPHELQDVRVCRPPIGVFKIAFLPLSLPLDAPKTPKDINRLTTTLLREGMVCLMYKLKDDPYMNIIVNEAGVWCPMITLDGFPADFAHGSNGFRRPRRTASASASDWRIQSWS